MVESSTLFKRSCGTIKRWFDEVTSYFELRITNGVVAFGRRSLPRFSNPESFRGLEKPKQHFRFALTPSPFPKGRGEPERTS
jgi:hypothetical protein